jgi:DNA-binding TFAR19-related protein (PDSD5 family)
MGKIANVVVQIDNDILKQLLDKISKLEKRVYDLEFKVGLR